MKTQQEKQIATEYKEFWKTANALAEQDITLYPTKKPLEAKYEQSQRHLIGMLEMYQIRYGDPEERLRIVEFIEKQIFGISPIGNDATLPLDMWKDLRKSILSGKYKTSSFEPS